MARFVNSLVNTDNAPKIRDPVFDVTYNFDDENDEHSETTLSLNENIVCKDI